MHFSRSTLLGLALTLATSCGLVALAAMAVASGGAGENELGEKAAPTVAATKLRPPDHPGDRDPQAESIPLPPPSEDDWPCMDCHEDEKPRLRRRTLDEHESLELRHGTSRGWCFDCHDPEDRDKLRLADGSVLALEDSHILCGQCHGDKFRDWQLGIHGKRTGRWDGPKRYQMCVHCHDPHEPRFQALEPMPGPTPPAPIR